jgi:hypothetical protein
MSLKRRREVDSNAFTSPQIGSDLKIIAGKGEAVETFYCDLYTLAQQSGYVEARFRERTVQFQQETFEIVLKDHEPKYVFTFLCIHYYRSLGERVAGEAPASFVPKVIAVAHYFIHLEAIDFIMIEYGPELHIKDAFEVIDTFHLDHLCKGAIQDYRKGIVNKRNTNLDLCKYLLSVGENDAFVFRQFLRSALKRIYTKLLESELDEEEEVGEKFLKQCDLILETNHASPGNMHLEISNGWAGLGYLCSACHKLFTTNDDVLFCDKSRGQRRDYCYDCFFSYLIYK